MPSEFQKPILSDLESGLLQLEARSSAEVCSKSLELNLCSNDYLGLSESTILREEIGEAVRRAQHVGGTGSRLLSGHFADWDEVESEFAAFAGTEAALYFGSGYARIWVCLASLLGKEDWSFPTR